MESVRTACARILYRAAGAHKIRQAAWIKDDAGNDLTEGYLCAECAGRLAKKNERACTDGGSPIESDGPASCDGCGEPIELSLTEYGIERELLIEEDPTCEHPELFPCAGIDAAISAQFADGIGAFDEKKHADRLLLITLATHYEMEHGRGSWKRHPVIAAVVRERKRLERLRKTHAGGKVGG